MAELRNLAILWKTSIVETQSKFLYFFTIFSYAVLKSMKEELEYRNVHLLSVIESERETKWKLEEFAQEQRNQLESLRKEVNSILT